MNQAVAHQPTPTADDRPPHRRAVAALAVLHAVLLLLGGIALSLPVPAQGWAVLSLVVAYAVALPLLARAVGRHDWAALALFLVPVSLFQVLPDWVLSDLVGTLAFPDRGGPRIDDVIPVAMAFMWIPPLFVAIAVAGLRPARAALTAVVLFAGAELCAPVSTFYLGALVLAHFVIDVAAWNVTV